MSNKVYLGSTNRVKVSATKSVLESYGLEVLPIEINSKVSNQPKNDEETITGAINRAKNLPSDGLRIGLEAGLEYHTGKLFLTNWGALIDENDNLFIAGGTRIELPALIEHMIFKDNMELAEAMEHYTNDLDIRSKQGAIGIFTNDLVKRVDIFTHIVKLLYGQYLYKRGESL
jgi:inosine/xanthosine triphosphatase